MAALPLTLDVSGVQVKGIVLAYAVGGTGRETGVAFTADLLVTLNVSGDPGRVHDGLGWGWYKSKLTLYLLARTLSDGSMIPPRRRRTRWRVDSFWMSEGSVVILL